MTTISGSQGTTIYMRLNANTIEYSTDSTFGSWVNTISSWPITLSNSTVSSTSAFTLKLLRNITISSSTTGTPSASTGSFIIGSDFVTVDGDFHGVSIDGLTNYLGLIQNGTCSNAFSNITISKLWVISAGEVL